ncbi:hypothetical protein DPMN_135500 [Dreissena polymorpha]|nr:hypothetical protein DPMN_135500 [Dreissena polymorpha]
MTTKIKNIRGSKGHLLLFLTILLYCGVPFVANAQRSGSSTTLGSNVTFICHTSYVLQGNPTSTCEANGSWSPLPSCSYQCEAVAVIPNGKVSNSCLRQSCTALISCNPAHDLIGQYNITCVPGGWSHEWPKCRPKDQLRGSLTSITFSIKPPSDAQDLKRFMDALRAELDDHLKTEMGSYYETSTVHSISPNGVANISFFIVNTDAAKVSFASSIAALIKGEPITVLNNKATVNAATLESGQMVILNQTEAEMSCAIYESIHGLCPSQTKCKYVDEKPICEPVTKQDIRSNTVSVAGGIVGGLVGLLVIVLLVVILRKYDMKFTCVRKKESTRQALNIYETPNDALKNNGEYETIGNSQALRKNNPDTIVSGDGDTVDSNAYESTVGGQR